MCHKRLRDAAPLYYNERHDFYAVSRYNDVERGLADRETFISGRGNVLEFVKSGVDMPPGIVAAEDPPTHTIHRGLMSRVFTPRKVAALENTIRAFCAEFLDPLVGAERFDLIAEFAAQMPMRVISMLLGIPEADQAAIRGTSNADMRTKAGRGIRIQQESMVLGGEFAEYVDWRIDNPSDDIMTDLLNAEFEDHDGNPTPADAPGATDVHLRDSRCGQRDQRPVDRLDGKGASRPSRPASRTRRGPLTDSQRHRGDSPVRKPRPHRRSLRR